MVHFDFEVLLLVLTLVTGAIWLVDVLLFARMRRASTAKKPPNEPLVIEYSRAFFPVLAIVLVLRAFAYEPFRIPSGSMMPSLLVGDFILVNKYSYGFRLPVWHTRINRGARPQRGDLAVGGQPAGREEHGHQHGHRERHHDDERDGQREHLGHDAPRQALAQQVAEPPGDLVQQHEARQRREGEDEGAEVEPDEVAAENRHGRQ